MMKAIVVYESVYGNTRAVAEAIADGLGGAPVVPVHEADDTPEVDLLVVGGPTHVHSLASTRSKQMAVEAAKEDGHAQLEPGATEEPTLRSWLRDLPRNDRVRAAAFDTRIDKAPWLTGVASHAIARRLARHGYLIVGSESFLVEDSEGPLEEGELERARTWAAGLAKSVPVPAGT